MNEPLPVNSAIARYLSTAHLAARRDFGIVQFERDALRRIGSRAPGRDLLRAEASPLEAPFGNRVPMLAELARLRSSALVAHADESQDARRLDRIGSVAGRARRYFDSFCFPPLMVDPNTGWTLLPPAGQRRYLRPDVHREARRLVGELLQPANLFDLRAKPQAAALYGEALVVMHPDIDGPVMLGVERLRPKKPLNEGHLAALVALVCLRNAIRALSGLLDRLAIDVAKRANVGRFDRFAVFPSMRHAIDEARVQAEYRGIEQQARLDADEWTSRAVQWLDSWEHEREAKERRAKVADRARRQVIAESTQQRSDAATQSAAARAERSKADTRARVLSAWAGLVPSQRDRFAVGLIARRLGLSLPTVREHLRAGGLYPPQSK